MTSRSEVPVNGHAPVCWLCDGEPGGCFTPAECSGALARAVTEDLQAGDRVVMDEPEGVQ